MNLTVTDPPHEPGIQNVHYSDFQTITNPDDFKIDQKLICGFTI